MEDNCLPKVDEEVLQLFPNLNKEEIIKRAFHVRNLAFSTDYYRYGVPQRLIVVFLNHSSCIDGLHFLELGLKRNIFYEQVFEKSKLPELRILEIGCCFGVDIRRLIVDGAKTVFGADLSDSLIKLGFEFFGDAETMKDLFFTADATSKDFLKTVFEKTGGKHDVIILQLVLHTVAEKETYLIRNIFELLTPGGTLIGCTLATEEDLDEEMYIGIGTRRRVIHSERTLRRLFASFGFSPISLEFSKWNWEECSTGWIEKHFSFSLKEDILDKYHFVVRNLE